jgi:hypothetical protein
LVCCGGVAVVEDGDAGGVGVRGRDGEGEDGAEAELELEIDVGCELFDDASSDSRYFSALTYPWM